MPAKRLLRVLILVQIPLMLAMGAASYLTMASIPEELRNLSANRDAMVPGANALAAASALAILIANVCLYFFWRGARIFYLVITAVFQLLGLFLGPYVNTGWTDLFETTLTLLNGLILGLIYFSPAAELFQPPEGANAIAGTTELASPAGLRDTAPPVDAVPICEACGARGQGGKFCPQCGKPMGPGQSAALPPPLEKESSRWPMIVGVLVAALAVSGVVVYTIVRDQSEKAAEKAREDKSNYDFEHRSFDPTKLLKGEPGAARSNPPSKTAQETDAKKGEDAFNRMFYERHCDMGDFQACGKAAVMYSEGRGGAPDAAVALALHRKACDGGDTASCEVLKNLPATQMESAAEELLHHAGTMSIFGVTGMSVADSQGPATVMFVRACDAGSPQGCAEAASRYRDGKGVPQDYGRAFGLYSKACAGGVRIACEDMKEIPAAK